MLSLRLIWHGVTQGMVRGFLYGALAGVWFWIGGALYGCVIGAVAGLPLGLLDGIVLAALMRRHRRTMGTMEGFIERALCIMPIFTLSVCLTLFCAVPCVNSLRDTGSVQWNVPAYALAIGMLPSCIAAFAAWQSVQKLRAWYK
ncbi:MAG: hypothetical protein ABIY70_13815 [Capsulimonas sp.]|uniref:hypothetical protein n=1 Tax=Capsulimonas sp. TaxID=2494211 RepID=UPI0032675083